MKGMGNILDYETLRKYYEMAKQWEFELIRNYGAVLGMSKNEAHILIHLWRNKGSYSSRIIRLLGIKRSTIFFVLERLIQKGVVFKTESPVTGNKVFKLTDKQLTKAYLAAAFKLCIYDHIQRGAIEKEIFDYNYFTPTK